MAEGSSNNNASKGKGQQKDDLPPIKYELIRQPMIDKLLSSRYASPPTTQTTEPSPGRIIAYYQCWHILPEIDLDHTADVQLHAWGESLSEAFEQVVTSMFGYMTTDYDTIEMLEEQEIEAEGDDIESLLFHFLDEWLFIFSAEPFFIPRKVVITEFDKENFKIKSKGYGEEFDIQKHPQGTEVKAITYSNMQIYDKTDQHEGMSLALVMILGVFNKYSIP